MRPSEDGAVGLGVEAGGANFCAGIVEDGGYAEGIKGHFIGVLEDWLGDFGVKGEGGQGR